MNDEHDHGDHPYRPDGVSIDVHDDQVKPMINEALYPLVPSTMTIAEFEVLTCQICDIVMEARERARK